MFFNAQNLFVTRIVLVQWVTEHQNSPNLLTVKKLLDEIDAFVEKQERDRLDPNGQNYGFTPQDRARAAFVEEALDSMESDT